MKSDEYWLNEFLRCESFKCGEHGPMLAVVRKIQADALREAAKITEQRAKDHKAAADDSVDLDLGFQLEAKTKQEEALFCTEQILIKAKELEGE